MLLNFEKCRPTFAAKKGRTIFWRSHHKHGWQKLLDNFLGRFRKNWAKIFAPPKICLLLHLWSLIIYILLVENCKAKINTNIFRFKRFIFLTAYLSEKLCQCLIFKL